MHSSKICCSLHFPHPSAAVPSLEQHIKICISAPGCRGAFIVSTSISFPLTEIKAAPSFLISIFSASPSPAGASRASPGDDCSFSGGKELIDHSQLWVVSPEQLQELHPKGLGSLFHGQGITRPIAAFSDHQSPSDCTNHCFHLLQCSKTPPSLRVFVSILCCFSDSVLFLGALVCFSLLSISTEGSNRATDFTTFPSLPGDTHSLGSFQHHLQLCQKNWKIINTRRLNPSFTSEGVNPLKLPVALCFKSLI